MTTTHLTWISTAALTLLQWGLLPHLLAQRSKSAGATLAWLWAILLFPGIGGLLYLLIGTERVQRHRVNLVASLGARLRIEPGAPPAPGLPRELEGITGFPALTGNNVVLLPDGTSFFPVMLDTIQSAQHHLHLEFYTWKNDKAGMTVRDALTAAARRGVRVRVLVDEIGSLTLRESFFDGLVAAGGKFSWFSTFSPRRGRFHLNLRNHRKLLIADGSTAMTGGMNVGNEYWGSGGHPPWRDLGIRLRGPVVSQFAEIFAQDWYFSAQEELTSREYYPHQQPAGGVTVQVVPGGPDNEVNEIQLATITLINRATQTVKLMTPYFVPEPPLLTALQLAAMRGVRVELLVPAKCDHFYLTHVMRSYYDELLVHGVIIHEYQARGLHAKVMTVDGAVTMCGSANLDIRSLRINFELNVVVASEQLASTQERIFQTAVEESLLITLEQYHQRAFRDKAMEAVFRPLAPLL